jgi:ubiquinone/menaquinone biosynthesis C-methylase UbiE
MSQSKDESLDFFQASYLAHGLAAQRRYPNEELARFIGGGVLVSRFFSAPFGKKAIRILELGCGSCANLWMIAREGFDAYGIDFSPEAILLGKEVLASWGVEANISVADARSLPFEDAFFNGILDCFSLYSLSEYDFSMALAEVKRVLCPGGMFFFYTPSTGSDVFARSSANKKIDAYTFDGLTDTAFSAYLGQRYPFRFLDFETCTDFFRQHGLNITKKEKVSRTYNNGQEYFEFISGIAVNE